MRAMKSMIYVIVLLSIAIPCDSVVRADILDDILSTANQASNRAAAARDRAVEARDRATEARDSADEIRDKVREGVATLTDQIRTMVSEAVEDLKRTVAEEMEGRDELLGQSGCSAEFCEPFRQDMLTLLNNIQTITNCLFVITELDEVSIDLSREIGIVQDLPGRALYPLYRVLSKDSNMFASGLLPKLNTLTADLVELKEFLIDTACTPVWEDTDRATTVVRSATLGASTLQMIGKTMISVGETQFFGDAGIHGYVHINVKLNALKKWGGRLVGLADAILPIVQFAGRKVDNCIDLQKQEQNQAELVQGQQEIMTAIKSLSCAPGNIGDLNFDGVVNLADFALFQQAFGNID